MKNKIIEIVGENSTGSGKTANEDFNFTETTLSTGIKVDSFYTYKGKVIIADDEGMDNDFDGYSEIDQKLIYNAIMSEFSKNNI